MKIAIHISTSLHQYSDCFNLRFSILLAEECPQHEFILIHDEELSESKSLPTNIRLIKAGPAIKNNLLLYFWYEFLLPRLLRKENASLFITAGDVFSSRTCLPQICLLHPAAYLIRKFRKKTYLKHQKTRLHSLYRFYISDRSSCAPLKETDKILRTGSVVVKTNTLTESEEIKEKYTYGFDYFLFLAEGKEDPDTITVLKAFSIFKKWQRSSMKMVITTDMGQRPEIRELINYKFKDDVILVHAESEEKLEKWIGGAFSGICFSGKAETDPVLRFLAKGIPLITASTPLAQLFWKDVTLFSNFEEKEIAENMIRLYKEDGLRYELSTLGLKLAGKHNWKECCEQLRREISAIID